MVITFEGVTDYFVEALVYVSCLYTSLAMLTSAIEHLKEFINKIKK